ncbi:molybdenum cofactor guanylyltransferase [Gillisia sp. Hel1_33_143]|uniref:molybdenum cofactor guanylyltransferase n=1 Tax=Gillisia sp. Hel1_33_143 TaxID=1336796 RepID=UPI000B87BE47|nr:molybdenum cofactor guanylyltransferase [Gillisia sp. Hel1_33_143]
MMRSDLEVFILAGGKSRRMGSEKGLVNFHGEPMIARILKVLEELDLPVRIISSNSDYLEFGTPVYQDLIPDKGPLGGLYTALEISSAPKIILLACDMPSINIEALHKLIEMSNSEELIVATDGKTISPFFACYPNSIKADVKRAILEDKLKMLDFIYNHPHKILNLIAVGEREVLQNLNTMKELNEAENNSK